MKKSLFILVFLLVFASCGKEQPESPKQDTIVPTNEIEALKKEIEELKEQLAQLTKIDDLESRINSMTSDYIEVDGLRFDKNGDIISTPRLETVTVQKGAYNATLKITRTLDSSGRITEKYSQYTDYGTAMYPMQMPFLTERVLYEYNGKLCKVTTRTTRDPMPVGVPYEETVVETTYW